MANKNWWIWVLTGTLLGILIMVLLGKGCVEPKTITQRVYKSDTLYITDTLWKSDTIKVPYEVVLPEHVYIYDSLQMWDTIERWTDNHFGYNLRYLGMFRDRPKLIEGDFWQDSIRLVLMDTSGQFTVKTWPTFYSGYDYHFQNHDLLGVRKPEKPVILTKPRRYLTNGNVYSFYSPIYKGFELSADYSVMRGKWGIIAQGNLRSYFPYSDLKAGVKYKFK